jgi:hypothetical protein
MSLSRSGNRSKLRLLIFVAAVLVLVQSGFGIVVNLYATIPAQHPGAGATNYFTGSADSIGWAISHGTLSLAIHASLGLALAVYVIRVAVGAAVSRERALTAWTFLAALFVIGAGFNGASFLDFANDISSLIMALLAFGALACYAAALYLLPPSR